MGDGRAVVVAALGLGGLLCGVAVVARGRRKYP